MKRKCGTCEYWDKPSVIDKEETNECRRYPPVKLKNGETEFPETYFNDWCGEYKREEKK